MLNKLDAWHKTRTGLAFFITLELILFVYLIGRALDTGSTWYYLLALIILFGSVTNCAKLIHATFKRQGRRDL